ncbi:P-loop containing nucleoside triphosphate hydrolase protein [Gonapodya prolifera JEL478]|uniref:p-loop containing nucleoside triphosphate hydrolase protein n=1 Tax=Gonapodya prolifera (strain JEL478) TaxID=1344416 RepID=A0A139A041_GONPJ|nr:P-loop containing nucleoside triphosphate hydrolase protein [Gonapodya prolifera JEL478]|eukprot:KXS10131.1 P-loop containing nucleoside triphosphate hydrolase protein [Gonapodya prolifera JEL478]
MNHSKTALRSVNLSGTRNAQLRRSHSLHQAVLPRVREVLRVEPSKILRRNTIGLGGRRSIQHPSDFSTSRTAVQISSDASKAKNSQQKATIPSSRIRNIGIVAHIDAGKTTTTERMLFYAGYTTAIGNVDDGNTVTDFLPEERDRGITIQSACIPLAWTAHSYEEAPPQPYLINLIDTPGHVDFTIEVERSLCVLDGCVVILDGVAGVEAQTAQVWGQANRFQLPRILVVNKMDRIGADFWACLQDAEEKLAENGVECPPGGGWGKPVPIQIPVVDQNRVGTPGNGFLGIVDLVSMEFLNWPASDPTGSLVVRTPLNQANSDKSLPQNLENRALEFRERLVEFLTGQDEQLVEVFLSPVVDGNPAQIPAAELAGAVRRATLSGALVPVLCAASLKNMGVQPIMDAVAHYLPSANSSGAESATSPKSGRDEPATALAFKVVHDSRRGFLTYVRVYSGTLEKQQLYNLTSRSASNLSASPSSQSVSKPLPERPTRILQPYGGDFEEIPSISSGEIAALSGFRNVYTGDILSTLAPSKAPLPVHILAQMPPSIFVPPPVYFVSIIPQTTFEEKPLVAALEILTREDPSISWRLDEESGQWILGGMGALHLEVVGNRLRDRFGVDCEVGKVRVGYRELVSLEEAAEVEGKCDWDKAVLGKKQTASVTVTVGLVQTQGMVEKNDYLPYTPTQEDQVRRSAPSAAKKKSKDRNVATSSASLTAPYHTHHPGADGNLVILPLDPTELFVSSEGPFPKMPPAGYPPIAELADACVRGAYAGLLRGPLMGAQISGAQVRISTVTLYSPEVSTPSALRSAVSRAVSDAIAATGTKVMEPVADVDVTCRAKDVGTVSRDLTGVRSGNIMEIKDGSAAGEGGRSVIRAVVPLAELTDYLSALRSLTGGTASMGVKVRGYEAVQGDDREAKIVKEARGY